MKHLGIWSMRLAGTFIGLFAIWLAYVLARPVSRPTFFSDPVHAALILGAAAAAIGGGAVGLVALWRRERAVGIYGAVLLGAFVLYWTVMELFHPA